MRLEEIREQTRAAKTVYADWLIKVSDENAETIFSFVKDATQYEAGRGEHLDAKGNWILGASLASMAALAGAAKSLTQGLVGIPFVSIAIAALAIAISLLTAAACVVWGIRVRAAWCPPNPEIVIRPEILDTQHRYLLRDLILHYLDNFSSNRRVSDDKAKMLQAGQWLLFLAFVLAVAVGICRMFIPA